MNIALYISNHGFGHTTRAVALIDELSNAGIRCFVTTDRPDYLFERCNNQYCIVRNDADACRADFGLIQDTWTHTDVEATKQRLTEVWQKREKIIHQESLFCMQCRIDFIISDIGYLPFQVAARLRIPSCGVSNFDWHYIYSDALKAEDKTSDALPYASQLTIFEQDMDTHFIVAGVQDYYQRADFAVKLPFSTDDSMASFRQIIPGDYLGSYFSEEEREDIKKKIAKEFRLRKDYEIVLLAFGGLAGSNIDIPALYKSGKYIFAKDFGKFNIFTHNRCRGLMIDYPFEQIFAAADIIITKTGYSTFTEAVKQKKKIVYTSRNGNLEDRALLQGIADYPAGKYLPLSEIGKANWQEVFSELDQSAKLKWGSAAGEKWDRDYSKSNRSIAVSILDNLFRVKNKNGSINQEESYALIDVGSNNVQLLWAVIRDKITVIHRAVKTSAMAKGMKDGILTSEGIARTKEILADFIEFSKTFTGNIVAIGTSCSRESSNIGVLTDWLQENYGIRYRIISEEQEAQYAGLANRKQFEEFDKVIFFDIGGGSTEFIYYSDDKVLFQTSLPLGIRRLNNEIGGSRQKQKKMINEMLSILPNDLLSSPVVVGIGGTVTNISAVRQGLPYYDGEKIHKSVLDDIDIADYIEIFSNLSFEEAKLVMPFEPERAEIIRTGLLIIQGIMKRLGVREIMVSDYGILFGAAEEIRSAKK